MYKMEDTLIVKTQFAYMLRVDVPEDEVTDGDKGPGLYCDNIDLWIEYSGCSFHLGALEKGKETGKLHFQMIVWFEQKLSQKEMCKYRNWWRGKCGNHKNSYAFASARKVASLAAYSTKEGDKLITNLSEPQLKKVPQWSNKEAAKAAKVEKFEELLKEKFLEIPVEARAGVYYCDFCMIIHKAYMEVYDRPCHNRNIYFRLALKYKIINLEQYFRKSGVLSFDDQ